MATVEDYLQNPSWVHRVEQMFDSVDTKRNGYLMLEDWQSLEDNFEKEVKPAAHLMAALRARTKEYYGAIGFASGKKLTKEEYLRGFAALAIAERARKERGEETLLHKMNDAWFDAVDTNHDGYVRQDELRMALRGINNESAAEAIFETLDRNKDGKIERKEISDNDFKFWFHLDDVDSQGMFGDKYEKK